MPQVAASAETLIIYELEPDTTYYFALKTADEVPNWSALSNIAFGETKLIPDTIPPAPITDLRIVDSSYTTITLAWTAPGDDGDLGAASFYDIRYSTAEITDGNFDNADTAGGEPSPSSAGNEETFVITTLEEGNVYYIAAKSSDEQDNWSTLSNIAIGSAMPGSDTVPPATIVLGIINIKSSNIALGWTATGDDDRIGTAEEYDIRYLAESPITDETWDLATQVAGEPVPQPSGSLDTFTVVGLNPATTYSFGIKVKDDVGLWSPLSNCPNVATTRNPTTWQTMAGRDYRDVAYGVAPTAGGGCAIVGKVDLQSSYEQFEYLPSYIPSVGYFAVIEASGNIQWEKTGGESGIIGGDAARDVIPTPDGGFIAAGDKCYYISAYSILSDVYLTKFDQSGYFLWGTYFSSLMDWMQTANTLSPTADGNNVVVWNYGSNNVYMSKFDHLGQEVWQKAYRQAEFTYGNTYDICLTSYGGYLIVGGKNPFSGGEFGPRDVYIFNTDSLGRFKWDRTFGGPAEETARGVVPLADGRFLIAGWTESFGHGNKDIYLIWVDSLGNCLDEAYLGGVNDDVANAIKPISDGSFVIAGYTESFGAGGHDVYLIKIDSSGSVLWEKTFGGTSSDGAYDVTEAADGGLFIVGWTFSYSRGYSDIYIIKTDANGEI